jgi:glucose-1-phosphate adenylyltransferase
VDRVVSAILGGGQGARLFPLTRDRAKPAVPLAGKFRLIDIPISNSLRADIDRIYVLTQFNSSSLHRHIAQTYRFDVFSDGFVNILAAEQSVTNRDWYQGTADAVRKNLERLTHTEPTDILILSGDQLYFMDLARFVTQHREKTADLTIAVTPVKREAASGLGIMRVDSDGRIVEFVEKPQDAELLDRLTLDQPTIDKLGLEAEPGSLLASMGIYTFRTGVLQEVLDGTTARDFGKEVIPAAIEKYRVFSYAHYGYWRDIGTIGSFHAASLELTVPVPQVNLYDPDFPIYTHPRFLPGSKIDRCEVFQSILSDGTIISAGRIANSIVGVRGIVRAGSVIEQSIIMGATSFSSELSNPPGAPLGIGRDCTLRRTIVDLDARIGNGCRLVNDEGVEEADGDNYFIREGIIVIPRRAELEPGTVI